MRYLVSDLLFGRTRTKLSFTKSKIVTCLHNVSSEQVNMFKTMHQ